MRKPVVICPQPGKQEKFLASKADIAIYGGAAGGGKTYALLLEPLRHMNDENFGAVIFRHEYTQITNQGGLWDTSKEIYGKIPGAVHKKTPKLHWEFPSGATVSFGHLRHDDDTESWQGSQITLIGFDELTHFSKYQFFYMLSRNRSESDVTPYIRATCNPDADSWVADFISWWIDQETGYPIEERSGKIRYMARRDDKIIWGDTKQELYARTFDDSEIKSVTFIASTLNDNKILMERNPTYLASLKAMATVERERLLYGNWKIKAAAGLYFRRSQITIVKEIPTDVVMWCRAWDLAATAPEENENADYTAGALVGRRADGSYVVASIINQRIQAAEVERLILNTAHADRALIGYHVIHLPQDPGAAGKIVARNFISLLAGFDAKAEPVTGSKELRATPFAAQWQAGNVQVVEGAWNEEYFSQLESFPESVHDDMVDASSDAFTEVATNGFNIENLL